MKTVVLADILTSGVITVTSDASLREALQIMRDRHISSLLVMEEETLVGIFTEHDAVLLFYRHQDSGSLKLKDINKDISLITAPSDMEYRAGYQLLLQHKIHHLIVLDKEEKLAGIVTESDFLKHLEPGYLVHFKEVGALMTPDVFTLPKDASVNEALALMIEHRTSYIIVEEKRRPVGILTERDFVKLKLENDNITSEPLVSIMTHPVVTVRAKTSITDAMETMQKTGIHRLVVVSEEGLLTGILTHHDIVKQLHSPHVDILYEALNQQEDALKEVRAQLKLERELRETEVRLSDSQQLARIGSWEHNLSSGELWWSDETFRIFEIDKRKFDVSYETYLELIHPEDRAFVNRSYRASLDNHTPYDIIHRLQFDDGRIKYVNERCESFYDKAGKPIRSSGTIQDITNHLQTQEKYRILFERTGTGIIIIEEDGTFSLVNQIFAELAKSTPETLMGKSFLVGVHENDKERVWEYHLKRVQGEEAPNRYEFDFVSDEGYTGTALINVVFLPQTRQTLASVIDITDRKILEQKLQFLAHHDALTHLPNRVMMKERLTHALKQIDRKKEKIAVLFVDLDHFKEINDSFGHPQGDLLLQTIAKRLKSLLRKEDTVARVSGDEFVIILEGIKKNQSAALVAQKILQEISRPMLLEPHEVTVTASIGIAIGSDNGEKSTLLLKNADTALYKAKAYGRNNFAFFSKEMAESSFELLLLHNALRNALKKDEFMIHYQPQIDLESGEILGAEALLRWNHPDMGMIPPDHFIPMAEDIGLINAIGRWVLLHACLQMKQWLRRDIPIAYITVNISERQLANPNIVDIIKQVLSETDLDAKFLELEITESTIMREKEYISILKVLKSLGIRISIDNFGTGYFSLSQLKYLPINRLKIDRSFVHNLPNDPVNRAIITVIITLAESLKLDIIAEGVETQEEADFLVENRCQKAQGYLYSKPLESLELESWLEKDTGRLKKLIGQPL